MRAATHPFVHNCTERSGTERNLYRKGILAKNL